jgi:enoyl-CoA hydratase/carnithine racemase
MVTEFSYKTLQIAVDASVIHITLNRPEKFNALNSVLTDELRDCFTRLYWRTDIRLVVLAGAGRHFCAGLDVTENRGSVNPSTVEALVGQRRISEIVIAMRRCPQPILAVVNGAASGGGFALALASDIRVALPDMKMNAAFIRIGLSACDIGVSYFLPRMVGSSVASEYLLTGRFLLAERARELGLVSVVVTPESLSDTVALYIRDLLHATPLGLRLTKEALNHAIDAAGLEAVIALEDRSQILCAQGPEFAEGVAAFLEKRVPIYPGSTNAL